MGLSRTVFEIYRKIFPPPFYFTSLLKWFPLELGTGAASQKTRMMGLPAQQKSLTIFSAVWIKCTNATDRETKDGQTLGKDTQRYASVVW